MGFKKQGEQLALPIDVHVDIFRNVLRDFRFKVWRQTHRRWQLQISGGPGSGKTTLAALIARQLCSQSTTPVVLIHVHDGWSSMNSTQPSPQDPAPPRNQTLHPSRFTNHDRSLKVGPINVSSLGTELEDLCMVLADQLCRSDGVHLIIDGFDRIQRSFQGRLQQNLCLLVAKGLRVLLLNAVPELDVFPPAWAVSCDSCGRGSEEKDGLRIYWVCNLCPYDLCDTCKTAGKHCYDESHLMSEPYDVVNMRLDSVPSELEYFVRADLEAEYGRNIDDNVIEAICEPSDGNINLAKLRLDQVRDLGAPTDIFSAVDRLPREVVAFFDAEIRRINLLEPPQRYQTLLAIIAVAEVGWMSVSRLEQLLSHASNVPERSGSDYPLVRRVLMSASGLLSSFIFNGGIASDQQESDRHRIALYIRDLGWYIREDYNQDLVLAKQYLSQARTGERNLDRSNSFEESVSARKEVGSGSGEMLLGEQSAKERLCEISGQSIVDIILREPGDLCEICQKSMLKNRSNSGVLSWSYQDQRNKCPICLYAYKELGGRRMDASSFHWARRTMGRTSNSNNHLVLTLSIDDLSTPKAFRRFVFMLKSDLGSITRPNGLGGTTTLDHTGSQIKKWLHVCKNEHVHCNHRKISSYVPKRLVDIDTGVLGNYRVIERQQKIEGPYVTLSHSWGRNPDFLTLTTKEKRRLMTEGFSDSELKNKNFKEAIEVARHLGVKYIWIDSLCICQAGKEKDFKEEGQYMHLVYQNSFCNIVAADSRDAEGGLFRNRPDDALSGITTKEPWVVLDKELWAKELLQSPIYTRGWVFQERMLSPRIIHFTRSQVFWDCSTVSACESLPEGLPFALSATATTDRRWRGRLQRKNSDQDQSILAVEDSLESFWKTAVLNYTSCELTNQADKTFAIWSVAKLVRDNLQPTDQYGCGLWSIALHEQLAWQVKATKRDARMDALQSVFPSWSWASVNAPVQIQDRIVAKRCYTIKNHEGAPLSFSDFKDKALNRDMQPQFATSESLAVRGHLIRGQLRRDQSDGIYVFERTEAGHPQRYEVVVDEEPSEALLRLSNFYLLPLVARKTGDEGSTYSGRALILIATHDYRHLTQSKLMKKIFHLVVFYGVRSHGDIAHAGRKSEWRMLRIGIDALNACLHKVAKQDRELPSRGRNAFRRVGVVQFSDLAAKEWVKIRTNEEKMIWLD